jgi:soluble lytic murein transglycosylase-like protein
MPAFSASSIPGTTASHITTVVKADTKTGRLVRSVVPPRLAFARATDAFQIATQPNFPAPAAPALDTLIDRISAEQGVESHLVRSVIRAESNYNSNAVSPKGALGIMQLIPETATRFGVADPFDPTDNIRGGVRYLRFLLDYFQGDYTKAIAAYNAGEAAVDKYDGVPPFLETRHYVDRVATNLKVARASAPKIVPDAPPPVAPAAESAKIETPKPIQTSTGSDGRVYYRTP